MAMPASAPAGPGCAARPQRGNAAGSRSRWTDSRPRSSVAVDHPPVPECDRHHPTAQPMAAGCSGRRTQLAHHPLTADTAYPYVTVGSSTSPSGCQRRQLVHRVGGRPRLIRDRRDCVHSGTPTPGSTATGCSSPPTEMASAPFRSGTPLRGRHHTGRPEADRSQRSRLRRPRTRRPALLRQLAPLPDTYHRIGEITGNPRLPHRQPGPNQAHILGYPSTSTPREDAPVTARASSSSAPAT